MNASAQASAVDLVKAQDPSTSPEELLPLAAHKLAAVRAAVASRSDCPMSALVSLGHDHDLAVLEALLGNKKTPLTVIRKLADHRNTRISDLAVQRLRNTFR